MLVKIVSGLTPKGFFFIRALKVRVPYFRNVLALARIILPEIRVFDVDLSRLGLW